MTPKEKPHDISEIRRAAPPWHEADVIKLLLKVAKDAVVILHPRGGVVVSNAAARPFLANAEIRALIEREDVTEHVKETAGCLRFHRERFTAGGESDWLFVTVERLAPTADLIARAAKRQWRLTPRQVEVIRGLLGGLSNKEIAERIGVSHRTVEVHIRALFDKSGVDTRTRLIARVRELIP